MIDVREACADLQATADYIAGITEGIDSLDLGAIVDVQDEVRRVKAKVDEAMRMLDGELVKRLEGETTRRYGDRVFTRVRDFKRRHDHAAIEKVAARQGVEAAVDQDTGAIDPHRAAAAAARAMGRFYLSPAKTAKTGPLDALGVPRDEYETEEHVGWKVTVTEIR